jgi:UDP-N-acetylmuramate--alanine ligase
MGELNDFTIGMPGLVNVENAVAALAVALTAGANVNVLRQALAQFTGIARRFDYRINTSELVYIDDYAHHPEELKAIIHSVKNIYPNKKITGIFQPHLYSRTRDFAEGFARSLSLLDQVVLLDIYPARELPIEGVRSQLIFDKITQNNKILCKKEDLISVLENQNIEVLLTLGAGDIDKMVEPIENYFLTKLNC